MYVGLLYINMYNALPQKASRDWFWCVKPKFHLFIELAEEQTDQMGDPNFSWFYKDEDFVGLIGKYAFSRGGGRKAVTTPNAVIDKYRAFAT